MTNSRRVSIVINLRWTVKHHHEVFAGTQRYARRRGWECVVSPYAPEELVARRGARAFDGVIARASQRMADLAQRAGVPLVNVWSNSPVPAVPTVTGDAGTAGRLAGEHLVARGFSSFEFIGFHRTRSSQVQERSFRDAVAPVAGYYAARSVPLSFTARFDVYKQLQRDLVEWIAAWPRPVAIAIAGDVLARTVAGAVLEAGLRVPNDVAIVGTGNEAVVCSAPAPTLSSIDMGLDGVGYRAAALLDVLMDGGSPPESPILVPPADLVVRGSTDAFAVDDPVVARALRFIADEGHHPIKVVDVVAQVPVSWRSLQRRFQSVRGCTIEKEITRLRIERVKRLLVETKMLIKQVATACGFAGATRLCEAFRAAEAVTPGQYRREHTPQESRVVKGPPAADDWISRSSARR